METAPALRLRDVRFGYEPGRLVLDGVCLDVPQGAFVGLVGPNGAGKSTLLALLTGLLRPLSGEIELRGRPLGAWARRDIARSVAVVPQGEYSAFPFTVGEIVLMGRSPHLSGPFASESAADRAIAGAALAEVGLEGFGGRSMASLSGGERQLVLIARALAQQTPILLLDEPTASLDLAHQQQILRIAARRNERDGLTVVMVAHDLNAAAMYCREVALLAGGRIAARGAPGEVLDEAILRDAYGADVWIGSSPEGARIVGLRR